MSSGKEKVDGEGTVTREGCERNLGSWVDLHSGRALWEVDGAWIFPTEGLQQGDAIK